MALHEDDEKYNQNYELWNLRAKKLTTIIKSWESLAIRMDIQDNIYVLAKAKMYLSTTYALVE